MVRQTCRVVQMPVRKADCRVTQRILGGSAELEQYVEARQLVEGFVASDRNSFDFDSGRLDPHASAAVGIVGGHRPSDYFRHRGPYVILTNEAMKNLALGFRSEQTFRFAQDDNSN